MCAINASCEFQTHSGTLVSSTNKADRHKHNITEILLKVVLNTINLNQTITQFTADHNLDR